MKHLVKRINRQATWWEKILSNNISDKGLESGIYKEPSKLNSKNNPVRENKHKTWGDLLLKTNKRWPTSLASQEMHIKMTTRNHYIPIRMAKKIFLIMFVGLINIKWYFIDKKIMKTSEAGEAAEKLDHLVGRYDIPFLKIFW